MPTSPPGWNLVPRWRTMMLPATTISPPNFLTPSRRPRLSRPLRDEPPAFLCAIWCSPCPARRRGTLAPCRIDPSDPQHCLVLAMAVLAPVIVSPLLLEDDDLVSAAVLDQLGANRGADDERSASRHAGAVADHQNFGQLNGRTRLAGELFDRDHVVGRDLVLLAAGADHCEHQ